MRKKVAFLLTVVLLSPPLLAQDDPFIDLLNNRSFDREALIRQFSPSVTVTRPVVPVNPDTPTPENPASTTPETPPAKLLFRPLSPQLPEGALAPLETLALVLPLNNSGNTAAAAEAFQQGCVDGLGTVGTALRVDTYAHDGSPQQAIVAYQNAVTDGASFIIGPMQKNNVRQLLQLYPQAPVKTLLLQPLHRNDTSSYYVLTIDIGEEAAELARTIKQQNYRALVVLNKSTLSQRQKEEFVRAWNDEVNAPLLEYFYIYDNENDWQRLFDKLKDKLETASEDKKSAAALPPLAIFAAGNGNFIRRTRNFVPQGYPLYASSVFFSSKSDAQFLDNLRVIEMPWFVDANADHIRNFTNLLIRTRPALQQRFYALGADACRAAQRSPQWFEGWEMLGASGTLELTAHHLKRRGILSQYEAGYLTPFSQ